MAYDLGSSQNYIIPQVHDVIVCQKGSIGPEKIGHASMALSTLVHLGMQIG